MNMVNTSLYTARYVVVLSAVAYIGYAPLDFMHHIATIGHVIYECIASIIEHFLDEVFGLSKFHSQLIVFYSSLAIGIVIAYRCIQLLPNYAWRCFFAIKVTLMQLWVQNNTFSKIKWLAVQTSIVLGLLLITLS